MAVSIALTCLTPYSAFSASNTQNNLTPNIVGLSLASNTAHFSVKEQLNLTCKWNVIYIDLDSPPGAAAYSMILSAHASGKKMRRLIYAQNNPSDPDLCFATLIEIE